MKIDQLKILKKIILFSLLVLSMASCTNRQPIINGVDEREANEIIVLLQSRGIIADKQASVVAPGGGGGGKSSQLWNIVVDPTQATEAMSILNIAGLPRREGQSLLDLFADPGLVPTEMQQKIRFQAGLAQQIANTIRQIDGVLDANVQLSFPPDDSNQPITASVYVKHNGVLDNPNSQLVTKIRQLVAGSVSGLSLENVTVVADRARYSDVTLNQAPSTTSPELEYVKIWSVVVAKDSVGVFRTIFSIFCIFIFILVCLLAWLFWKCYPMINKVGGVSSLWKDLKPLHLENKEDEKPDIVPPPAKPPQ